MRRREIRPLTSMRFFAAFGVVLYHLAIYVPTLAHDSILGRLVFRGYIAVPFFFVLSGFVLRYNYDAADVATSDGRRRFWLHRFARVYPLYLVAFVVAAAVLMFQLYLYDGSLSPGAWASLVATPLLLQSWIPPWSEKWNPPGWSLSVEAAFYAAFPFLLLLFARRRGARWLVPLAVGAVMLAASLAAWMGTLPRQWHQTVTVFPLLHAAEFIVGMLAAEHVEAYWSRVPRAANTWIFLGATGALVATLAAMPVAVFTPEYSFLNGVGLLPIWLALVLAGSNLGGPLGAALDHRALLLLGNASYAVYLLHWPVLRSFNIAVEEWQVGDAWLGPVAVVAVVCVVLVGIASYLYLERPAKRLILAAAERRAARRTEANAADA